MARPTGRSTTLRAALKGELRRGPVRSTPLAPSGRRRHPGAWPPRQSEDLLDLAEKRIALLSQQRADLVVAMGGEPNQESD
jgi:hypothetical protein